MFLAPDTKSTAQSLLQQKAKLWMPEPGEPQVPQVELLPHQRPHPARPEPPPEARPRPDPNARPRSKSRSRSRRRRSKSRSRPRKKRGGWDKEEAPASAATTFMAPPSRPALPPGIKEVVPGGKQAWTGHVQVNRF